MKENIKLSNGDVIFEVDKHPFKTICLGVYSWQESSFLEQMQKVNKSEA